MESQSLFLVLFEQDLYDCIRQTMKKEWLLCEAETERKVVQPIEQQFFPILATPIIGAMVKESLVSLDTNSAASN